MGPRVLSSSSTLCKKASASDSVRAFGCSLEHEERTRIERKIVDNKTNMLESENKNNYKNISITMQIMASAPRTSREA